MKSNWSSGDIPRLDGRTAIVTGASSGIGYEIALQLAAHGAQSCSRGATRIAPVTPLIVFEQRSRAQMSRQCTWI
jgi:NAD(P)-dependent dehydrogenase (short-subunit alcohol dehydrogenase family)